MGASGPFSQAEIERGICDLASKHLSIPRTEVHPETRLIEDLHADSLDVVILMTAIEETFGVSLSFDSPDPFTKSIFTRSPIRLRDFAEAIYLGQERDPELAGSSRSGQQPPAGRRDRPPRTSRPFTQLDGLFLSRPDEKLSRFEPFGMIDGTRWFRRRTDGMRCALLPGGAVELGSNDPESHYDERPRHPARLDPFLIDAEPVSTTAYCRFLNSIEGATEQHLTRWVLLTPDDDRQAQFQIARTAAEWRPLAGTETAPMVLVSWFGAQAYALWANGHDWRTFDTLDGSGPAVLPSEAQWEYAAQGADQPAATAHAPLFNQHQPGAAYSASSLPMAPVHEPRGCSRWGLHHMAGNVWHWCHDWYAEDFYRRPDALGQNPVNAAPTGIRSERGGSWVGPAELGRVTYRRGRPPEARGRCLGFRTVSPAAAVANIGR